MFCIKGWEGNLMFRKALFSTLLLIPNDKGNSRRAVVICCCQLKKRNRRSSYESVRSTRDRLEVGRGKISLKTPFLNTTVWLPGSTGRWLVSQLQTKLSMVRLSSGYLLSRRSIEEKGLPQNLFESSSRIAPPANCSRRQTVRMLSCNNC